MPPPGHDIDDATADHLLFTCGSLMTELVPEIGKIAAYAKGRAVTMEDINAVADPVLDARVFDMTNSITAGKYDQAAQVLGELLRMQTEPIVILAAVGKELRRLYTARMALDAGKDRFWLKQLWSMSSDYPAKLLLQAAGKVDHEWCQNGGHPVPDAGSADEKREEHGQRGGAEAVPDGVWPAAGEAPRSGRSSWWRGGMTRTPSCRWWTP